MGNLGALFLYIRYKLTKVLPKVSRESRRHQRGRQEKILRFLYGRHIMANLHAEFV